MKSSFVALSCAAAFVMSAQALAQSMGNADSDAPTIAKIHRIQPYEIVEGTPHQCEPGNWGSRSRRHDGGDRVA